MKRINIINILNKKYSLMKFIEDWDNKKEESTKEEDID